MAKIQSAGSVAGKETIYVDVDDEITVIIDKLRSAKGKVVALVLPKRATMLQSVVNMKLLKRTAETAGKNLVLVTTEAGLMPLAGMVGLFVASTPTSKPAVPPAPSAPGDEPEDIDEPLNITDSTEAAADFDAETAADQPVGELAAAGAAGRIAADDIDEDIQMGDEDGPAAAAAADKPAPKKNKKLAVPNFDSFRKKLLLGGGILVLLIVALVAALVILPKATVTIHTDSSTINTSLNLALVTTAKSLDTTTDTVPATSQSQQKTATQTVPATGQQNNGNAAHGQVAVSGGSNCNGGLPNDIPAGTSLSTNSLTYTFDEAVTFVFGNSGKHCVIAGQTESGNSEIDITALKGGSNYNTSSSASFTVSGRSDVSTTGSASGGSDNIIKIVSQSDIAGATAKITASNASTIKQQLVSDLQTKGLQAVQATFLAGTPQVTSSAQAGQQADTVTVTSVTNYTMLGVKQADLKTLVDHNVTGQLDKGKQVILDDGVANASFSLQNAATATAAAVSMQTKSVAGPQLNIPQLKTQLVGKKSADVKDLISQTPGVTSVDVKYSPFWVSTVPKKASKLTITIDKAGSQ